MLHQGVGELGLELIWLLFTALSCYRKSKGGETKDEADM